MSHMRDMIELKVISKFLSLSLQKLIYMINLFSCVEPEIFRVQLICELIKTIFRWKVGFVIHLLLLNAIRLCNNNRLIT